MSEHASTPSGILTFLFTDIEGSTRRWEADPAAMQVALETHDQTLRRVIEQHHGRIFKHTGDGVCAVFTSPKDAVEAAITTQRDLELPVRMGIATGEAQLRDGDYFGTALNRAARIMAAGHGGQILIDGATASLLDEIELISFGPRRLRDLAKPVELHQVRADGIAAEFPPLRAVEPAPGNLRPTMGALIGREAELARLQTALGAHRLVTLTGPGGVGKTRLALHAAERLRHKFQDGVWAVELANVNDPKAVPEMSAAVLGITTQQPGMSVADSVAAALEGRSLLMVLDNCEHVLDAAADIAERILTRAPDVKILATSRESLLVPDERLWPLAPLDVDTGADSAAVELFVERAEAVAPAITLAGAEDAIVEICRRLDGIPLAIELAASRLQSMTVTEIRDRLDDRFRLLVGSRRAIERHQTLGHAVQWSYDLLSHDEKDLLTICSVFVGGFDLAAAAKVSTSEDEFATLDLIDSLVRKSLVTADCSGGRTRYSMLETIRQFAEAQLALGGTAEAVRRAHAHHFAALESEVMMLWNSPRQREAYEWFDIELSNLRVAFRYAADHADVDSATAIAWYASYLGDKLERREPFRWAEELVESARALNHRRLSQLYVMAAQCYATGRLGDARSFAEMARQAIDSGHYDEVPFDYETSVAGGITVMEGAPQAWIDLCRKVIERSPGDHIYARASLVLGLTLSGTGDDALQSSDGLLEAAEASHNPFFGAYALTAYGMARRDADPRTALDVQQRGLIIARDSGNRQTEHILAVSLARLTALHIDDPAAAFDFLTLALRTRYESGSFTLLHPPLAVLATVLHRLGRFEPAAVIASFAVTSMTRVYYPELGTSIGDIRQELGDATYEELAHCGANMTNAEMTSFAFDQIDQARAAFGGPRA